MLRREDPDDLLSHIPRISQIQQKEEALMDVTEVEELLLNCGPMAVTVKSNFLAKEEKPSSYSNNNRDLNNASILPEERKGEQRFLLKVVYVY